MVSELAERLRDFVLDFLSAAATCATHLSQLNKAALNAHTPLLAVCFVLCALGYSTVYARLTQFRWCFRAATLATEASAA